MRTTSLVGAWVCLLVAAAEAQVPAIPEPVEPNIEVACGAFAIPADELAKLRTEYLNGRWERLQSQTRALLVSARSLRHNIYRRSFQTTSWRGAVTMFW
jgi:hypothetical protein